MESAFRKAVEQVPVPVPVPVAVLVVAVFVLWAAAHLCATIFMIGYGVL